MWEVMSGCKFQRLGVVMESEPGKAQEIEGVLNPVAARCPDGKLPWFKKGLLSRRQSRIAAFGIREEKHLQKEDSHDPIWLH
jgi:hypothetical protein